MDLRSFLSQCKRLLRLSKKPTRKEFWLFIKILLIGLGVIGITGYVIRLISTWFTGFIPST